MVTNWKIGDTIENRFQIQDILGGPGKSGMGIVYVVYDSTFKDIRVLKTLQDRFIIDAITQARFKQEATAWVNLDVHQNVTQALMVEYIKGRLLLHLEYVNGGDLSQWVGTPRLVGNLPQILRFAIQFCDGMTHVISKGIQVHRDIKPQNCLITGDNTHTLKVTDFGLAKALDDIRLDIPDTRATDLQQLNLALSRTGTAAGTCTHMAPEQFDDAKQVDMHADIYAFGVMLFQMVTGGLPFVGRTWQEFEHLHKTQPPPKLSLDNARLESVIQICLAKEASNRYPNFDAVRNEVADVYSSLTGETAPQPVTGAALKEFQLNNKGLSLHNLRRHGEAIAVFDQLLELNPNDFGAWFNKANALRDLERYNEALACLDRALLLSPQAGLDEYTWGTKALILHTLNRLEEAIIHYDRAIAINPNVEEFWHGKASILHGMQNYPEAELCYARVVILNPQNAEAWLQRGEIFRKLEKNTEAVLCYDRVIALQPNNYFAWTNKGIALAAIVGQSKPAEPLACFDRALAINPRDSRIWHTKAMMLIFFKREREAMDCFTQAHKLGHPNAAVMIAALQQRQAESASTVSPSNLKPEPQNASLVEERDIAQNQALKNPQADENSHTAAKVSPGPAVDGQGKNRNWLGAAGGWILVAVGAPLSLIGVLVALLFMISGTGNTSDASYGTAGVIGALIICAGPFLLVGLPLLAIGSYILIRRARNQNKVQ